MSAFLPRKPDYVLKVKSEDRNCKDTTLAGVAWLNDDGSLSMRLNPAVVLSYSDGLLKTLFPNTPKPE